MRIAIRFGHTILTNGQCTASNGIRKEYEVIREYAPLVIKYLKQLGYEVFNVTPKDKSYSTEIADINAGIKIANDWKADLFLSLHANNFDTKAFGCEVLYSKGNTEGLTISTNICKELEALGFKNRGAKFDVRGLNEIIRTHMTSVIVEPLFIDNLGDIKLYSADKIARSIVKGLTGKTITDSDPVIKSVSKVNYILEFQRWYNATTKTKAPIPENGINDERTEKAYKTLGELLGGTY
jgi:N-acetylmuramoyl-L-alanine amidase